MHCCSAALHSSAPAAGVPCRAVYCLHRSTSLPALPPLLPTRLLPASLHTTPGMCCCYTVLVPTWLLPAAAMYCFSLVISSLFTWDSAYCSVLHASCCSVRIGGKSGSVHLFECLASHGVGGLCVTHSAVEQTDVTTLHEQAEQLWPQQRRSSPQPQETTRAKGHTPVTYATCGLPKSNCVIISGGGQHYRRHGARVRAAGVAAPRPGRQQHRSPVGGSESHATCTGLRSPDMPYLMTVRARRGVQRQQAAWCRRRPAAATLLLW